MTSREWAEKIAKELANHCGCKPPCRAKVAIAERALEDYRREVWEAALEHAADFCEAHVCSTACPSEQCKMANDLAAALRREAHAK